MEIFFQKLEYRILVESTTIYIVTIWNITDHTKATVKTNMWSTNLIYHKDHCFPLIAYFFRRSDKNIRMELL